MNARTGSGLVSTAVAVAALVAAGVGGFAAYSKITGGCGPCSVESTALTTVSADAKSLPSCCASDVDDAAIQTVSADASSECCHGKAAAECSETTGTSCSESCTDKSECEQGEETQTESGDKTAASNDESSKG